MIVESLPGSFSPPYEVEYLIFEQSKEAESTNRVRLDSLTKISIPSSRGP